MKKGRLIISAIIFAVCFWACEPIENDIEKDIDNGTDTTDQKTHDDEINDGWLIPESQVFDGGPGKDGIPALINPKFVSVDEVDFLSETSMVIGIQIGDVTRAYPHNILDWHEIVNDAIGSTYFSIIYCPLTGTGMAWNRELSSGLTSFGVSGLLYNSNIIPYDRDTDSNWSQIRLQCVGGELKGEKPELISIVETTWATWTELYPDTKVVSTNTGHTRNYGTYPYGDYLERDILYFPVSNYDDRVFNKERVHGIIHDDGTSIFRFDKFTGSTKLYSETIGGERVIVVGNEDKNFIVSFVSEEGADVSYNAVQDQFPVVFEDSNGSKFDLFGNVLTGADIGRRLESTSSFMGFWFSWAAFYTDLEIQ